MAVTSAVLKFSCVKYPKSKRFVFTIYLVLFKIRKIPKSKSHLSKKYCFICFNKSPLKAMENAFYFVFKAISVLKIFKFCLDFLVMWKKRLD